MTDDGLTDRDDREAPEGTYPGPRGYGGDVALTLLSQGGLLALALVNNIVIARFAGPSGRGIYAVAVAVSAIAWPIACLGLASASAYKVARNESPREVVGLNLLVSAGVLLVCGMAGLAMWSWGGDGWMPHEKWLGAVAAMAALPAIVQLETARHVSLGMRHVGWFNLVQLAVALILLLLNVILLQRGPAWVLLNWLVAWWIMSFVTLGEAIARRPRPRWPTRYVRRTTFRYGLKAMLTKLSETGLMRADYLLLVPFVGVGEIGVYAIADQLALLMSWAGIVPSRMMLVHSARSKDATIAAAALEQTIRFIVLVMVLGTVVVTATFWWVIPAVFGEAFGRSYSGLLLLLPMAMFRSLHAPISTFLAGQDRQGPAVLAGGIGIVVMLVLVPVGAYYQGWHGAAAGKSLAYAVQCVIIVSVYLNARPLTGPFRWIVTRSDLDALRRWIRAGAPLFKTDR